MMMDEMKWIPISDGLPPLGEKKLSKVVLVTVESPDERRIVSEDLVGEDGWITFDKPKFGMVVAWMPYPEPYMGD